jgi:hypothetical protein
LKRKRARKGSVTPAAETPAATPAPEIENLLVFLMTRFGLEDHRQAVETFIEHANAATGEQLRVEGWSTDKATEPKPAIDIEMRQQSPPPWLEPFSQAETDPRYSQPEQQWIVPAVPKSRINEVMTMDRSNSQPAGFDLTYFDNFANEMSTSTLEPVPTIIEPPSQSTVAYSDPMDDTEPFDPSLLKPLPPAPRRGLSLNTNNTIINPSYPGVIRVPCH